MTEHGVDTKGRVDDAKAIAVRGAVPENQVRALIRRRALNSQQRTFRIDPARENVSPPRRSA